MSSKPRAIDFEKKQYPDGFTSEKYYLNELERSLFERLDIEETFESTEDGFDVSNKHLKILEENILTATSIKFENINGFMRIPLFANEKFWLVAASIAAILTLIVTVPKVLTTKEVSFANLTLESEEWYLNEHILFLTDDELSSLLADDVFDIEIEDADLKLELENYIIENELYLNQY